MRWATRRDVHVDRAACAWLLQEHHVELDGLGLLADDRLMNPVSQQEEQHHVQADRDENRPPQATLLALVEHRLRTQPPGRAIA